MSSPTRPAIEGVELDSRVARGSRAELWKGHTPGGKAVAVKIFLPHISQHPRFLTQFEKHTSALRSLSHPNVLPALDRGKSGSTFFLVTEWVERGSLRDRMLGGRLTVRQAVNIGLEVCEALDYAHRRGLLHRNLVLENILTDAAGRTRVADFSLSLLHTPQFEQYYEARNDLHALGSVLYELVLGGPPPERFALPPAITDFPQRFSELLSRALSPDASARFSRASEMALALRLAAREDTGKQRSERPETAQALTIAVTGKLVTITVAPNANPQNAKAALHEIDTLLGKGGPWRLAYDLGSLSLMDDGLAGELSRLHVKHQKNLEAVAFSSPRALVRSSALLIGGAVRQLPWKMFAVRSVMQQWLEREGALQ
jgi:serine/threonine protein kinase